MSEILGWIATTILTLCAIPQFIKMYKTKSSKDISVIMWWLYLIGHIIAFCYAYLIMQPPLLGKYSFNILISILILIMYYRNDNF
jgi:MtN3 and saliva related transmembrane protein